MSKRLCMVALGFVVAVLPMSHAYAERCEAINKGMWCSCQGKCQRDQSQCRCENKKDPGTGDLVCTALNGQDKRICKIGCERDTSQTRCNPK